MLENLSYYDISPEISESLAVWPGDQPFQRKMGVSFEQGGNLLLSSIHSTVHLGAHTDAPNHYHPQGQGIEARPLDFYLGRCQVISVEKPRQSRILPADIAHVKIQAPRILFKTLSYPDPHRWNGDFNAFSPELVEDLARQNVILLGIDTPSVDLSADPDLLAHHAIYKRDMAILEGIVLHSVPDGIYTLVALPLKIKGADASPVRAILIREVSHAKNS